MGKNKVEHIKCTFSNIKTNHGLSIECVRVYVRLFMIFASDMCLILHYFYSLSLSLSVSWKSYVAFNSFVFTISNANVDE